MCGNIQEKFAKEINGTSGKHAELDDVRSLYSFEFF